VARAEPCVYEAYPGAASAPLASLPGPAYRQRQPQRTVLHRVVRENLRSFLAEGEARSASGAGYPYYVEKEFRDYLLCGDATRGFARARCGQCGHELFLPPSCKNRGICPSCTARRMSEEAAYLVDMVLPEAGYRQWTVTFPFSVRFLMARDHRLITAIFGIVLRLIFAWQRRQARRAGHRDVRPAAVGLIQRFGGALNCNVHGHLLIPDGVFVRGEGEDQGEDQDEAQDQGERETLRLVPLGPPETADLERLVVRLARRTVRLLEQRFGALEVGAEGDTLEGAIGEAMSQTPESPRHALTAEDAEETTEPRTSRRCASVDGFSIHANTAVAAGNRVGLEKLLRYGMRPPFSQDRLSLGEDGKVHLRLQRPWPTRDGVSVLTFEPLAFLRRLSPLIPPPYAHTIRYWGLLAPNATWRDLLPAAPVTWQGIRPSAALRWGDRPAALRPTDSTTGEGGSRCGGVPDTAVGPADGLQEPPAPAAGRTRRQVLPWHELLRRVFAVDALLCPRCLGPMTVIAFITEAAVVAKILAHLGLPTTSPPLAPARLPAQQEMFDDEGATPADERPGRGPPRSGRGPPGGRDGERWVDQDDHDPRTDNNDSWGA